MCGIGFDGGLRERHQRSCRRSFQDRRHYKVQTDKIVLKYFGTHNSELLNKKSRLLYYLVLLILANMNLK